MNGKRRPAILAKVFRDIIRNPLCANEDENLSILSADDIKMLDQLGTLLKVTADLNDLGDIMIRCKLHRAYIDLNKVLQEILEGAFNSVNSQTMPEKSIQWQGVARPSAMSPKT